MCRSKIPHLGNVNKTSPARGGAELLPGGAVQEIVEFKRQGLTVSAISDLVRYDRKTIRKYLREPDGVPEYRPRAQRPSKLDRFKPHPEEWVQAGV